ncbi:MAG: hypothetical protein OEY72_10250 [Gammaproteobacteria bacterium]|nr:hypothetical protein [Gammaproteobacteria bacterium]
MAREIDPNNLSAGDVLRVVAPTIAVVAVFILVGKFAPDYVWLLIALLVGGIYVYVSRLPKKDLAAIAEREQHFENKIGAIPVVGPIAKPAWRLLNWLAVILGAVMLVLIVVVSIKNLL